MREKTESPCKGLCSLALAVDGDGYGKVVLELRRLEFLFGYDLGGDLTGAVDLDDQARIVEALGDFVAVIEIHAQGVIPGNVDGVLHTNSFCWWVVTVCREICANPSPYLNFTMGQY